MKKDSPLNGKKILVVDDETDLRQAILFDLKRRGCQLFEAGSGDEAWEIVQNHAIDIVISDVRMPNGNGIDLLKNIRGRNSTLPKVVLASGFADISEPEAQKLGASALIEKPINRKAMFEILES